MLHLDREAQELRAFILKMDQDRSLEQLERTVQATLGLPEKNAEELQKWRDNVPPKIREIHGFTAGLAGMSKAIQASATESQKSFAMAETTADGLLKQGRETLQFLQNDNRAMNEKWFAWMASSRR